MTDDGCIPGGGDMMCMNATPTGGCNISDEEPTRIKPVCQSYVILRP